MHLLVLIKTSLASFLLGALSTGSVAILCELGSQLKSDPDLPLGEMVSSVSEERSQQVTNLLKQGLNPQEVIQVVTSRSTAGAMQQGF